MSGSVHSDPSVTDEQPSQRQEFLRWLIDYEIRGSERYRRFLSLLLVVSMQDQQELDRLRELLRMSDEVVTLDAMNAAVLLRETDVQGTLCAIDRYKSLYRDLIHTRFAIVSYPSDGWNANLLLGSVRDKVSQALEQPDGAVVC